MTLRLLALALLIGFAWNAQPQSAPLPPGTSIPDEQPKQQPSASDPLADTESAIEGQNYSVANARLAV